MPGTLLARRKRNRFDVKIRGIEAGQAQRIVGAQGSETDTMR
jgi:hypothetical protein